MGCRRRKNLILKAKKTFSKDSYQGISQELGKETSIQEAFRISNIQGQKRISPFQIEIKILDIRRKYIESKKKAIPKHIKARPPEYQQIIRRA